MKIPKPEMTPIKVLAVAVNCHGLTASPSIPSRTAPRLVLISGLTAQQAMGCVVVGAMITGILSVVSGKFFLCILRCIKADS